MPRRVPKRRTAAPKPKQKSLAPAPREGGALAPTRSLALAAQGKQPVRREDLEGVLAHHVAEADLRLRHLGRQRQVMLEMVLGDMKVKGAAKSDPLAALEVVTQLDKLHRSELTELRRCVDLLHRISSPQRPSLQVVAAGQQVNVGAAQQIATSGKGSF